MQSHMYTENSSRQRLPVAVLVAALLLLAACGGKDRQTLAEGSDVVVGTSVAGPTPFISLVPLSGQSIKEVVGYRYTIAPKSGAVTKAVDVGYTSAALTRQGHYPAGGSSATLPVFGLYSGHANKVAIELTYSDGSRQDVAVNISAPAYVDPFAVYDRRTVVKARVPGTAPDLNYFFIKSGLTGPTVIDSDGEIRWVAPTVMNAFSSAFEGDGFIVGDPASLGFSRLGLDGKVSVGTVVAASKTKFHHSIDHGKVGLLIELDGTSGGIPIIESSLTEIGPKGNVLKEWDFADIIGRYMRARGDDPSAFIRPGIDWFHINAATYDARDDSIIASSRENFIIKVGYSDGDIKWILGDPAKYWYTFPSLRAKALKLDAGGLHPIGQHSTSITSKGELMVFNNGLPSFSFNQPTGAPLGEARTYSAVSSYVIDPLLMTARQSWVFDYDKTIFSDICSSVYEAKSGSYLVSYAAAKARNEARLVGLDAARNVVFDYAYDTSKRTCYTSWNAEPIAFEAMSIR